MATVGLYCNSKKMCVGLDGAAVPSVDCLPAYSFGMPCLISITIVVRFLLPPVKPPFTTSYHHLQKNNARGRCVEDGKCDPDG